VTLGMLVADAEQRSADPRASGASDDGCWITHDVVTEAGALLFAASSDDGARRRPGLLVMPQACRDRVLRRLYGRQGGVLVAGSFGAACDNDHHRLAGSRLG
jgi:hypothetical protein